MTNNRHWLGILVLSCGMLAALPGCETEWGDMGKSRGARAVDGPSFASSGTGEVMGGPVGAVPIVTVDMPNTKNDPVVVHTIVEPLREIAASQPAGSGAGGAVAATRAAESKPAEAALPAVGSAEIKVVGQQRPADQFRVTRDNEGNADVWVLCPMGIGTVTLERTGDAWPAVIRVHLRYDTEREFTRLEGFTASELTAAGGKVGLKAAVEKETGKAEVTVPGFARGERIMLEWVDMYR